MGALRVATLQLSPRRVGDTAANVSAIRDALSDVLRSAATRALDLLVLPEMITTGYRFREAASIHALCEPASACFADAYDASSSSAERASSPSLVLGAEIASQLHAYVVIGFAEKAAESPSFSPNASAPMDARLEEHSRPAIPSANAGFYNSAALFDRKGALVHVFRKHFLYDDDKVWANEGAGFQYVDLPDIGRLCVGICMDLNPYEFKAPFQDFELASFCAQHEVDVLALPTAWLLSPPRSDDELGDGEEPGEIDGSERSSLSEPSMSTIEYWAWRCQPLYTSANSPSRQSESTENQARSTVRRKPTVLIAANRTGTERGVTFAGSSAILHFQPPLPRIINEFASTAEAPEATREGTVRLLAAMGRATQGYQESVVYLS